MWHSPSLPSLIPFPTTTPPTPTPPFPAFASPTPAPRREAGAPGDQSTPADCKSLLNLKLVLTLEVCPLLGPGSIVVSALYLKETSEEYLSRAGRRATPAVYILHICRGSMRGPSWGSLLLPLKGVYQ
ncbi:hypothetical protein E2C01_031041 [Portunus trituberculatus]|uniref:Uncharacterized protein n=1 Tax=Portunus trituberculatus TaxID=210409 RepID=A0A5B7EVT8_PORTR|nr:hypothetical protein [Portunus trituberculatus]